MLEQITAIIIHLIQTSGYFGIFILMTLESALIPIPSEITMPFSGFLAAKGELSLILVILTGALGNLLGSLIAYYIGYYIDETVIVRNIKKYGKFILVSEHEHQRSKAWFLRYGESVIFFSRLLPAIRTFISLPAGLFKMNIWKFSAYTFIGSLIWSAFLAYIGLYFENNWREFEGIFRKFDYLVVAVLVFLILFYINQKLKITSKFFKN